MDAIKRDGIVDAICRALDARGAITTEGKQSCPDKQLWAMRPVAAPEARSA